jgi:predicted SAM-dependent methyltransferase
MKKLHIGCGPIKLKGYLHSDVRHFPHIDFVCKSWEVSNYVRDVDYIYSRHMLEHLTNYEADRTLRDWLRVLKTGGIVEVIVPNLDYHCKQWLSAEWTTETVKDKWSDAQHGFAGFYGWQSECDPWSENYNTIYWDVHKSGYNKKRASWLFNRIGFSEIEVTILDEIHLVIKAKKIVDNSERQTSINLDDIRSDHKERYFFASNFTDGLIKSDLIVLDAASGVGYGSKIISDLKNVKCIDALDISDAAHEHAKKYFYSEKVKYLKKDFEHDSFDYDKYNVALSFETIEHIKNPKKFIKNIYDSLKEGGLLIGSVPNQNFMPYNPEVFKFHERHYTQSDIFGLLDKCGFKEIDLYQQLREDATIKKELDGHYIIFIAKKV